MKTLKLFILTFLLLGSRGFAQLVTTKEYFPNGDSTITIIFDLKQAKDTRAVGLLGKTSDVYLWSGAGTSDAGNAFEYQPAGQTNFSKPMPFAQMTSLGNDKWSITLKPRDFYKIPSNLPITKLGLLLKSGDGKAQTEDFILSLYDGSFQIKITSPTNGAIIYAMAEFISLNVSASSTMQHIDFYLNDKHFIQSNANSNQYNIVVNNAPPLLPWANKLKVVATSNNKMASDSINFVLLSQVNTSNLPSPNIKDGINYINDSTVTLSLFAPQKQIVFVIGEFNNWQFDTKYMMNRTPDGSHYWLTINNLEKGKEYAFQYLVDGKIAVGDPYSEKILDPNNDKYITADTYPNLKTYPTNNPFGGIVSVLQTGQSAYNWKTTNFKRPNDKNLVVYELLVRDFVVSRKYRDVADSLGYLKNLGVNAIELMPFTEFTGNDSWGYNPIYYIAPDKAYGTKNDLKYLIDKAHSMGMSVIQDIVFNQADNDFPYVKMYWDGTTPSADSPFFNQQSPHLYSVFNDFNHESVATQNFVDRVCNFWLTEYKVDGFRFDLSKGFTQKTSLTDAQMSAYDALRVKILKRIYDKIRSYDATAHLILEHFADNTEELELSDYGFMLWGNFNNDYRNVLKGVSADFKNVYAANLSWNYPRKVAYMESHDEERLIYDAQQNATNATLKQTNTALEREKLATAFFLTIPGPKMIWQFGEFGYDISINQNGRTGAKPLKWEYLQETNHRNLFNTYQALLKLRTAISQFNDAKCTIENTDVNVKRLITESTDEKIYVLGNFGLNTITQKASFPVAGTWNDFFTGTELKITNVDEMISLSSGEFHVFTTKKYATPPTATVPWTYTQQKILSNENPIEPMIIFPNPSDDKIYIKMQAHPETEVVLENLAGKMLVRHITDKEIQDVDMAGLPAGIYFVRVRQGDMIRSKKIVKE